MPGFDTGYIAELLRRQDRERYLTTLLAPAAVRGDLMVLYAFAAETARIRAAVSEVLIGHVKLQWWREVIGSIYDGKGAPKGNPLTEGLQSIIASHALSRAHFETLLETRSRDLAAEDDGTAMRSIDDLESYADGTAARLTWLALEILGAGDAASLAAGRHAGIAHALSGILRALPFELRHNRVYFAEAAGSGDRAAIADLGRGIADRVAFHVGGARALTDKVPRAAIPALLPATIAARVMNRFAGCGGDVFDPRFDRPVGVVPALVWNAMRGRF